MRRHIDNLRDAAGSTTRFVGAAAYIVIVTAVIIGAAVVLTTGARGATQCSASPEDHKSYWSWREIDHRRCWYRNDSGRILPKSALFWGRRSAPPPPKKPTPIVEKTRASVVPEEPNELDLQVPGPFPDLIEDRPFGPWEERIMGAFTK